RAVRRPDGRHPRARRRSRAGSGGARRRGLGAIGRAHTGRAHAMRVLVLAMGLLAPLEGLDLAAQHAVQEARRPWLEPVMHAATDVGKPAVVLGGLLAIAVLDPAAGVTTARVALATLVPTNLVVEALKRVTQRPRPDGVRHPHNASFPSSHAAN